jgi:SAM-dependent methyltransferase
MQNRFPPGAFARRDESPDTIFYEQPRLVTHIDEYAIAAVGETYRRFLPAGGEYLDLMSSWVSHFPDDFPIGRLVGHGMNEVELRANPKLSDYFIQDLNQSQSLPYEDNSFDGVLVCVSIQYLTKPVEMFREISRILKPGAPLIVTYSNRCFQTKAVSIWLVLDDEEHGELVSTYASDAGAFDDIQIYDMSPRHTFYGVPEDAELRRKIANGLIYTDPLFAVVARKRRSSA